MANEPKTIVYNYMFNYFGKDIYNEKTITGANILLAIKAYKDSKEIKFNEEPRYSNTYWSNNFKVSFDKCNAFAITKSLIVDNLFRLEYGFDKIEAEIVGYTFNYLSSFSEEEKEKLPDELKDFPIFEPMEVNEEVFKQFILSHRRDFDIPDNACVQVTSVGFI